MSELQDQELTEMGTKPQAEHTWLQKLVGNWTTESEMSMGPDQPKVKSTGTETVVSLGGLWAFTEGQGTMPNGEKMHYKSGIGYDVSFNEYRGFWIADVSSHLWAYKCELSADGKTMTNQCTGPSMEKEGESAEYRDVIELIDDNTRTMTSYGQDETGNWIEFVKVIYKRA